MPEERKLEIRSYGQQYQPRIREAADGGESRTIEGYAIVFGVESVIIQDWYETYREIIEPGAITEERLKDFDIKMTCYHNRQKLLARSNKGVGTLKLTVDEVGVKYEFEAPKSPDGENALESVRRGDLAGSSFTYWSDEKSCHFEKTDEGILLRHVDKIDYISEMTIASDPAYQQTTVTAREVMAAGIELPETGDQKLQRELREKKSREQSAALRELANS